MHTPMLPLRLLYLLLPFVIGQQCAHFSQEDLVSRLEAHLVKCLGPSTSSSVLSTLTERFVANDYDRHQPLALVLFSNTSDLLHTLAGAVASALFGIVQSPNTVQAVDFQELLEPLRTSNHDIKQTMRVALSTALHACPERNLFVFDNVQELDDAALPVLDVLLDPLNGRRAQYQHYVDNRAGPIYDCTNSVFLFLYKITASSFSLLDGEDGRIVFSQWREYLTQQWTRSKGIAEEFTPEAFVGRLTDAVAVFQLKDNNNSHETYDQYKKSNEWRQLCKVHSNGAKDEVIKDENCTRDYAIAALAVIAETVAATTPMIPSAIAMLSIPAFLLILTRAKRWNEDTSTLRNWGAIHRRSNSSNNIRRKKKKCESDGIEEIAVAGKSTSG